MPKFNLNDSGATILQKLNNTVISIGTETGADYVCDGVADDVKIQAAMDYINNLGGGKIEVRKGTYEITTKMTIPSNIEIAGENWLSIFRFKDGINNYFFENKDTVGGNENINVHDMSFDGNKDNNTMSDIFNLINVSNSSFARNRITNAGKGWRLFTVTNSTFENNFCDNPKRDKGCFNFQTGSNYNKLIGNRVDGYTVAVNFDGANSACSYNVITENIFTNDQSNIGWLAGDCILMSSGLEIPEDGPEFNVISNNTISGYGEDGIRISDNCRYITVTGNTVFNIGRYPIVLAASNFGCTITGNTIYGGAYGTTCDIGIFVDSNSQRNVISGNTVRDCNFDGINLNSNGNDKNIVTGNSIYNVNRNGIYVLSNENTVNNNFIDGNGTTDVGIYLLNSKDNIISNNLVKNNTTDGIRIQETIAGRTVNNIVMGNRCFDDQTVPTQDHGINEVNGAEDPDYNIFLGNNCLGGNTTSNLVVTGSSSINQNNLS